jgi:hypothetical protein
MEIEMLAKRQKAREAIQGILAQKKIYVRPEIAGEVQMAFERMQPEIAEDILGALENAGMFED